MLSHTHPVSESSTFEFVCVCVRAFAFAFVRARVRRSRHVPLTQHGELEHLATLPAQLRIARASFGTRPAHTEQQPFLLSRLASRLAFGPTSQPALFSS